MTEHAPRAVPAGPGAPHGSLEAWVLALAAELGVDLGVVDVPEVLDVARDSATSVGRPAAPLTTFLIGYAAGSGSSDVAESMRRTRALADGWDLPASASAPEGGR